MAKAIIVFEDIPGFDLSKGIFKDQQFAQKLEFDFLRRLFIKARKISHGTYEFNVNGITYRARMTRVMKKWEKAYYADSPETSITELMNVYP